MKKLIDDTTPLQTYRDHVGDVIDISWSVSNFLLTASLDKTVRLWHVSRWVVGLVFGCVLPAVQSLWPSCLIVLASFIQQVLTLVVVAVATVCRCASSYYFMFYRPDCLMVCRHPDVVSGVSFHPLNDRFFLTGCLDKKLRVWDMQGGTPVVSAWAQVGVYYKSWFSIYLQEYLTFLFSTL
jgi:WD40 repeat protein